MSATLRTQLASPRHQAMLVIIAAALVMSATLGIRQTFGLFVAPFSAERDIPITLVAFAIAMHNLAWGAAQPFAGAAADRYGTAPVVAFGAIALGVGLALTAAATSGWTLVIGLGLLVGIGVSCTSFGVVLTAVGRVASPETRSMAMGLASAGGSLGQVLLVPMTQGLTDTWGMAMALLMLALLVLSAAPLGLVLDRGGRASLTVSRPPPQRLGDVVSLALSHRGYRLLTLGFFTCGFQLAFIVTHLPGYLSLCHMPIGLAASALALVGLFNMAGSWACGWLGGRFRPQYVLGWLYLLRGVAIALFVALPKSPTSVLLFAAVMGLAWLGTVPLTSGLVARMFGIEHLGTLFGVCFLSHQVGSFLGAWLGGVVFDLTGSYSLIWAATATSGLFAALLHFPIRDEGAVMTKASPA